MEAPEPTKSQIIDSTLSKANLCRLRGQYQEAEAMIEALLTRFPDHAEANSMLGDIVLEQGRLADAELYYVNAEDHGGGPTVTRKLQDLRTRIDEHNKAEIAQRLGFVGRYEAIVQWAAICLIGLIILSFILWLSWRDRPKPKTEVVVAPVEIPFKRPNIKVPPNEPAEPQPPKIVELTNEDAAIRSALEGVGGFPEVLRGVAYDPRSGRCVLTFLVPAGTDNARMLSTYGDQATRVLPSVKIVTVRITDGKNLAAIGDFVRDETGAIQPQDAKVIMP